MQPVKLNLNFLVTVFHEVNRTAIALADRICLEQVRLNAVIGYLRNVLERIVERKRLVLNLTRREITEQCVFKAVQGGFPRMDFREAYVGLIVLCRHIMVNLAVFLVNHKLKPIFIGFVQLSQIRWVIECQNRTGLV